MLCHSNGTGKYRREGISSNRNFVIICFKKQNNSLSDNIRFCTYKDIVKLHLKHI